MQIVAFPFISYYSSVLYARIDKWEIYWKIFFSKNICTHTYTHRIFACREPWLKFISACYSETQISNKIENRQILCFFFWMKMARENTIQLLCKPVAAMRQSIAATTTRHYLHFPNERKTQFQIDSLVSEACLSALWHHISSNERYCCVPSLRGLIVPRQYIWSVLKCWYRWCALYYFAFPPACANVINFFQIIIYIELYTRREDSRRNWNPVIFIPNKSDYRSRAW